jgi:predicted ester cyclase
MTQRLIRTFILFTTLFVSGGTAMADNTNPNISLISDFAQQVFVNKDLNNLNQFMGEDYIQHNPYVEQGSDGFKRFFETWFTAIPDFQYELKNLIVNDDFIWVYGSYSGTHSNEWLGIPATQAEYQFDAVDIFRVEDGKLAEHWDVMDLYSLFQQLKPTSLSQAN